MALQNRQPARSAPKTPIAGTLSPEYTLKKGLAVPIQHRSAQTGSPVGSVNGDTAPAQQIVGTGTVTVTTKDGVTTINA